MSLDNLSEITSPNGSYLTLLEATDVSPRPGVLASLAGSFSDTNKKTRNDRRYTVDLWDKVIGLDYVQEMMATKSFFGEADHPGRVEQRMEVSLPKVSHAITKLTMNKSNGILEGALDILDTPAGRIINTLREYGAKLGVSSRGFGRTITKNGENIPDPSTYRFITFDIVALPANANMRLDTHRVFEGISLEDTPTVLTAIEEQVDEIVSRKNLFEAKAVQELFESMNLPEIAPLSEKLKRLSESTDIDTIKQDLSEAYKTICSLKGELESANHKLSLYESKGFTNQDGTDQIDNNEFMEQFGSGLTDLIAGVSSLRRMIESKVTGNQEGSSMINDLNSKITSLNELLESQKSRHSQVVESLTSRINNNDELLLSKDDLVEELKNRLLSANNQIKRMSEQLGFSLTEMKDLKSTIRGLSADLSDKSSQLDESVTELNRIQSKIPGDESKLDKLSSRSQLLESNLSDVVKAYVKLRCSHFGLSEDTVMESLGNNYSFENIESAVSKFLNLKANIDTLPINVNRPLKELNESSTPSDNGLTNHRLVRIISAVK